MKVLTVFAHPDRRSFCGAVLDRLQEGLIAAGHDVTLADLHAERFNPVFGPTDNAFFADASVPDAVLERMELPDRIIRSAGGPVRRAVARHWVRGRSLHDVAQFVYDHRPKDVLREQARVRAADGLAIIAPIYWLGFPAILKGWIERVFTYGFAYRLTPEGWNGELRGRIPLLHHAKALLISTTFFGESVYETGLKDAMERLIDSWGFRFPGIRIVEHRYFWAVSTVDAQTRSRYLQEAFDLGLRYSDRGGVRQNVG
jgi:NAD(P)H dehydrogenase (quinone)